MWGLMASGIDGSYRIFTAIVGVYEEMGKADVLCHQREIGYTMRNRLITGEEMFGMIEPYMLVRMLFLFWYGFWWGQPEDMGFAIGVYIKQIFSIELDDFVESEANWTCPHTDFFDSRETYRNWMIGVW